MKLNLDYYDKEMDLKMIPEEFDEVLEKVNKTDSNFAETLDLKSKIKNILALSEIRENILNWYEFKNECNILELNANYGEITGLLCQKAKRVVSIESSYRFSKIIQKRHKDKDNLELIVGNIDNIDLKEKFDYVVIVGIAKNLKTYLEYTKKYLKDSGVVLIAVNNKFGIKSWISLKEDNKVISNNDTAVPKNYLNNLLKGFDYRFYYPLPDYKLTNIIYTENHAPSLTNINRDLTYKDEEVNFKEVDAYREILKEEPEKVLDFANSFLVEASKEKLNNNEINYITFSNIRKDKYRIKTIIKEKEVYKDNINEKSKEHIKEIKKNIDTLNILGINTLDSYNETCIISKFCKELTLDKILINTIKEDGIEKLIDKIKEYINFLQNKLGVIEFTKENIFAKYKIDTEIDLSKLHFTKNGLWDLIFQNCFVVDNEYYFYDQEWFEENIPIEFIIYRAIKYFNELRNYTELEKIYNKLNLNNYIEIFDILDDKLQEKIRKPLFWRIHTKDELVMDKIHSMKNELKETKFAYEELQKSYDNLKNEFIEKNNELSILKNSISWKITKPLRKIRSMGRKSERK